MFNIQISRKRNESMKIRRKEGQKEQHNMHTSLIEIIVANNVNYTILNGSNEKWKYSQMIWVKSMLFDLNFIPSVE